MSSILKAKTLADEADTAQSSTPAAFEDQSFAGPAPDQPAAAGPVIAPQANGQALSAPAVSLLRFITCGSVDDGKSTLIGRLLFETNAVFDDQMEALKRDSKKFGTTGDDLDFALLVDGLSAEREQGITIDVAYRYFSTASRAFIIADTPGHEQYTRNMATGASQAELAIILVDARKGILPQTRRHSFITSLVGIKSVIIAVNKMDLVDFSEERFAQIKRDYQAILPALGFTDVTFVPVSAKNGDNIVSRSANTPWYDGETLLERLESVEPATFDAGREPFRMPVQWVNRPNLDFRGFAGSIVGGEIAKGDAVVALPSGGRSRVKGVFGPDGEVGSAEAGEAVTITLEDEIDVSRGDVLTAANSAAGVSRRFSGELLWMANHPLIKGGRLILKLASAQTPATLSALDAAIDIHSYAAKPANALSMNEIGKVTITADRPIVALPYGDNRELGAFILIDPVNNETVALGVVRSVGEPESNKAAATEADSRSGLQRLRDLWLGQAARDDAAHRQAKIRARIAGSVLVGFLALLFHMPLALVPLLAILDFLLRPFLAVAFGADQLPEERPVDPTVVDDGGGI
ncbi:sulfate adenylyltransferase subunit CysN [Jiella sp. MQZ9-1]|uniref:Sulfate adenylyltransferase subunit 1 n=1 Tax=Jiella flava TaxID=2816857 RepID=A0A939FW45_9HYPH|nr:sulfate adenylyltransferase subunit CysN [Jiella flava]MBO0661331.1 sulfate adenylyltransferase subunit CysN [Jiella flava]MCD2469976.1 sulfate adenylyltransferase subunit CysN [Jiella flava]